LRQATTFPRTRQGKLDDFFSNLLGFGFNTLNVRRLALNKYVSSSTRVLGTANGISNARLRQVKDELQIDGDVELLDLRCTEFIQKYQHELVVM
jgi:hypothetical protein